MIHLDFEGRQVWPLFLDFEFQNSADYFTFLGRLAFEFLEFQNFAALGSTFRCFEYAIMPLRFHLMAFLWILVLNPCFIGLSAINLAVEIRNTMIHHDEPRMTALFLPNLKACSQAHLLDADDLCH